MGSWAAGFLMRIDTLHSNHHRHTSYNQPLLETFPCNMLYRQTYTTIMYTTCFFKPVTRMVLETSSAWLNKWVRPSFDDVNDADNDIVI